MKKNFYTCLIGVFAFLICTTASSKPSAPIEMQYTFDSIPTLGRVLQVDIQFSTSQATDEIKASIKTTSGLHLQTMQHSYNLSLNKKSDTTLMTIRLIPQKAGLNYLHITAHIKVRGKNQAKAFSIPVTIGWTKKSQKTSSEIDTPSNQSGIIYLPVIERIQ